MTTEKKTWLITGAGRGMGLDITKAALIDVLVNNAASFYAGYFEELTPEQMDRQITTSLIGPMNVTRAVLPVMRKQGSGDVLTISSSAGFAGFEYGTAYAASKFGVDGWMESLAPGFFRTELLTKDSTNYAPASIEDDTQRNAAQHEFWDGMNGKQGGDPDKLAERQQQIDAFRELSSSLAFDEVTS